MTSNDAESQMTAGLDPRAALRSIFSDPQWGRKTATGATFNALSLVLWALNPVLMLPVACLLWALVGGYLLKVIRVKLKDPSLPLPPWGDWIDMLISGLTWMAAYTGAIFLIISAATISILIGAIKGCVYAPDPGFVPWAITSFTITFVIWLLVTFITTFVQANFAEEERVQAAFALRKVLRLCFRHPKLFLQCWLIAAGLGCASILLPTCTVIGIVILPATTFIAATVCATMIAQTWRVAQLDDPPISGKQAAAG